MVVFSIYVLNIWFYQFKVYVDGQGNGDKVCQCGYDEVKNIDIFVVGGYELSGEEIVVVFVFVVVNGCVCYVLFFVECM